MHTTRARSDNCIAPTAILERAALLAALIRGLVADALDAATPPSNQSQDVLRANIWRASRDGLNGRTLHPVTGELTPIESQLDDLVERLRPGTRPRP